MIWQQDGAGPKKEKADPVNEWNRLQCTLLLSFPSREARAFSGCTLSSTVHKHTTVLRTRGSEILYIIKTSPLPPGRGIKNIKTSNPCLDMLVLLNSL
jgi:hypothetical protein